MTERVHHHPNLIYSPGTQVVALADVLGNGGRVLHPRGSVGVVVKSPRDLNHSYRVRFLDARPPAPAQHPSAAPRRPKSAAGRTGFW